MNLFLLAFVAPVSSTTLGFGAFLSRLAGHRSRGCTGADCENGQEVEMTTYDPVNPHEIKAMLHQQQQAAESIVQLWNMMLRIGPEVADSAVRIVYISALMELEKEIADQEAFIASQLTDVNAKIKTVVEDTKTAYLGRGN